VLSCPHPTDIVPERWRAWKRLSGCGAAQSSARGRRSLYQRHGGVRYGFVIVLHRLSGRRGAAVR